MVSHADRDAYLDVFRNKTGLGGGCQLLFERIDSRPIGKTDLLAGIPKSKRRSAWRTLTRQFTRLRKQGLATQDDQGRWQSIEPTSWAAVAKRLRSNGATERQRRRYEAERKAWRERVEGIGVATTTDGTGVEPRTGEVIAESGEGVPAMVWALAVDPTEHTRAVVAFLLAVKMAIDLKRNRGQRAQRGPTRRDDGYAGRLGGTAGRA